MNILKSLGCSILMGSAVMLSAAAPVQAQSDAPGNSVCLPVTQILSTQAIDRHTILYRMRDGTVWRNTLVTDCPSLVAFSAGGFSQVSHNDYICANSQQIRTQTGNVCRLGPFTRAN